MSIDQPQLLYTAPLALRAWFGPVVIELYQPVVPLTKRVRQYRHEVDFTPADFDVARHVGKLQYSDLVVALDESLEHGLSHKDDMARVKDELDAGIIRLADEADGVREAAQQHPRKRIHQLDH